MFLPGVREINQTSNTCMHLMRDCPEHFGGIKLHALSWDTSIEDQSMITTARFHQDGRSICKMIFATTSVNSLEDETLSLRNTRPQKRGRVVWL
jgi:hypothetical protein